MGDLAVEDVDAEGGDLLGMDEDDAGGAIDDKIANE